MDKINNIINDLNEKIKAIKIVLNQNSLTDLTNEIIKLFSSHFFKLLFKKIRTYL